MALYNRPIPKAFLTYLIQTDYNVYAMLLFIFIYTEHVKLSLLITAMCFSKWFFLGSNQHLDTIQQIGVSYNSMVDYYSSGYIQGSYIGVKDMYFIWKLVWVSMFHHWSPGKHWNKVFRQYDYSVKSEWTGRSLVMKAVDRYRSYKNEGPRDLERVHIPHRFLVEIRGFVDGYNTSVSMTRGPIGKLVHSVFYKNFDHICVRDVVRYHLLGESKSGCTCVVSKNAFGRNLDWCPFGAAGNSVIVNYHADPDLVVEEIETECATYFESGAMTELLEGYYNTIDIPITMKRDLMNEVVCIFTTVKSGKPVYRSITVAGMLGTMTAIKNREVMAMNVSPGHLHAGMSAVFMNRELMEKHNMKWVRKNYGQLKVLANYHLTFGSKDDRFSIAFHGRGVCRDTCQCEFKGTESHLLRTNLPIYTVNFEYPDKIRHSFDSDRREAQLIENFGESRVGTRGVLPLELIKDVLRSPSFNTICTVQSMVFDFKDNTLNIGVNNGFAGSYRTIFIKF